MRRPRLFPPLIMEGLTPLFPGIDLPQPLIISGPCSAESKEQTLRTARALARLGIRVFRSGVWKPRTHPGCFEGAGERALEWLRLAKEETGMLTATEVATPEHAEAALDAGVDMLWIGARTSANPFATQQIADTLRRRRADVAVLVKNPVSADLELWIGALQRIRQAGITRLGAVHRGFSAYAPAIYRNEPLWSIPMELRRRYPTLPLLCDPSHIAGKRELVGPLARQSIDMGYYGLMIECHCCPGEALSDSQQQLTPAALRDILRSLSLRRDSAEADSGSLTLMREQIDSLDRELIDILARRMDVCRQVGQLKKARNMPVVQTSRLDAIISSRLAQARDMGISPECMRAILTAIHAESVRQQLEIYKQ